MNIDIIMPVYNEEKCLPATIERLLKLQKEQENHINFIFVLDGCIDKSFEIINEYAKDNKSIKIIEFSKNYGQQIALLAGYKASTGDFALTMDVDLQDPPELLNEMLDCAIKNDADIVIAKKRKPINSSFIRNVNAYLFYRILNMLLYDKMTLDAGDFRLTSKKVVEIISDNKSANFSFRGIIGNWGFKTEVLEFDRNERKLGKSHYTFEKCFNLAVDTLFSRKNKLNILMCLLSFVPLVAAVIAFAFKHYTAGLILLTLFSQSIILCIIGQFAHYIFNEIKDTPRYTIKNKVNL